MAAARGPAAPSPAPVTGIPDPPEAETSWAIVVPVKLLARAKSRLSQAAGTHREHLALALAGDTVTAALACARVCMLVAVTDDPLAARTLGEVGAQVVPDVPDSGLNPALRYGASVAESWAPGAGVVAMSADLPSLRPDELARALDAAAAHDVAYVPDAAATGTTLYAAGPGHPFAPAFGAGSRDRHTAAGAYELAFGGLASVRRDVDTPADLDEAVALGVGPRTAGVIREMRRRSA